MSWWSAGADPGDWVRTTTTVSLNLADQLLGHGGLPPGTRGVVLERYGSRLRVEFDNGWGSVTGTVRSREVQVVRRGAGAAAFRTRTSRLASARLAVAFALALPVLQFVVAYLWANRSFDGIGPAFVTAALYGAEDSLLATLHEPRKAVVYFVVVTLLYRFAFGRRAR